MCRQLGENYPTDANGNVITFPAIVPLTLGQIKALRVNKGGCYGTGPGVLAVRDNQLLFSPHWNGSFEFTIVVQKGTRNSSFVFTLIASLHATPISGVK